MAGDVLSGPNPLLVVNGRVNVARAAAGAVPAGRKITAIEANHMVDTSRVNTRVGL